MTFYYPKIPNNIELVAVCVDVSAGADYGSNFVHIGKYYKVKQFVEQSGFFPYGVRVIDYKGNELNQTFYIQRFIYFERNLN